MHSLLKRIHQEENSHVHTTNRNNFHEKNNPNSIKIIYLTGQNNSCACVFVSVLNFERTRQSLFNWINWPNPSIYFIHSFNLVYELCEPWLCVYFIYLWRVTFNEPKESKTNWVCMCVNRLESINSKILFRSMRAFDIVFYFIGNLVNGDNFSSSPFRFPVSFGVMNQIESHFLN